MPGDFDFFNDEPAAPPRPRPARAADPDADRTVRPTRTRRRRDDEQDEPGPRHRGPAPKGKLSPLLIVAIIAGSILALAGGVVGIVLAVGGGPKPTEPKDKGGTTVAPKPVVTPKKDPADPNTPTRETIEHVKKATVRILVEYPGKKGIGSGSGFVEKDTRVVLTNAHVVGMRKITDPEPLINLVVNSGQGADEYRLTGEVVAVDAENDLAVIRPQLLTVGERTPVPDGLVVPKTSAVKELDPLFVFGFPLGDLIGREITVSQTKVTSLRRDPATGKLNKIQVQGGMTFGNSGGPVVDVKGNVIGVAVSGIKGSDINFCVPGEMVHQILANRKNWKD